MLKGVPGLPAAVDRQLCIAFVTTQHTTMHPPRSLLQVFPNLHIIHQTRDGRDVAMSNLNSTSRRMTQPYQRHYVKLISGESVCVDGGGGAVGWVHVCLSGHWVL